MGRWVAIGGVKYSGKDTFAEFFVETGYKKINFADNLKHMCASVFDKSIDVFYDSILKETNFDESILLTMEHVNKINAWVLKTHAFSIDSTKHIGKVLNSPRDILQYVGTEILRDAYKNYHTEATMIEMSKYQKVVCSDIRFPNERDIMTEKAKELGHPCVTFYVRRPGKMGDTHASETSIQAGDMSIVVENDTTIEGLGRIAALFLE